MDESRRAFLKFIAASGLAGTAPYFLSCTSSAAKKKPPNFIIFLADDLGYGDLGCYGNPIIQTPHIDAFATQGIRFTDCHAAGTVCSPSRAGLLTGRNPYRSGFYYIAGGGAFLHPEEKTIASLLKENGYDTCFTGKWHLGHFNRDRSQPNPGDHGFDHWFATAVNAFEGPRNPTTFYRNGTKIPQVDGWYCDAIVRESLDWLRNRPDPEKPFFLFVSSHEPHTPLSPPEHFGRFELYDVTVNEQQQKDISAERPELLRTMISQMKALWADIQEEGPYLSNWKAT